MGEKERSIPWWNSAFFFFRTEARGRGALVENSECESMCYKCNLILS
jgi:hypothetical protein